MLLLLTAVTAVAMGSLMVLANSRWEEAASRSTENWARALAGNAAASAQPMLQTLDAGIGMSAEQLARVFQRFCRVDPSGHFPGTGQGMSLDREIVELQRGRVDIDSQIGAGTTVTLCWPLSGMPDSPARPREVQALLVHGADAASGRA